jgi:anti-sigma B factor antagonist
VVAVELSLSNHALAGHTVVDVAGEADVYTAQRLREYATDVVDKGARRLVLDLTRLESLGSATLGVIVGLHRRLYFAGGSFAVVCTQPRLLKVLSSAGLDRTLRIVDSVRAATEPAPPPRSDPDDPAAFQARLEAIWRESVAAARKSAPARPPERRIPEQVERAPGGRAELSAADRGRIVELYVKGKGILEVAEIFAVPDDVVWRLLRTQGLGPAEWP